MKKIFTLFLLVSIVSLNEIYAWGWAVRDTGRQPSENPAYFLGDYVYFSWDFNADSWGASYKKAGIGTSNNSSGINWQDVSWVDEAGDGFGGNEGVKSSTVIVNSTGTWYYSLWIGWGASIGDNGHWYSGNSTWNDGSASFTSSSFTVSSLNNPSSQTATTAGSTSVNLSWSKDAQSHNVMIVRKKSTQSWTEPTQGSSYSVGASIGSGVVVYNGSGTSTTSGSLSSSTSYDYKFYSENNSYYSAGVTANATTSTAASDYFRSNGTGNWSVNTSWQSSNNATDWVSASVSPTSSATSVTIQNGHTVAVAANQTAGALTINSGGVLEVNAGIQLSLNSTFSNSGTLTLKSDATGAVATITTPASISGSGATYNVEQYLTTGRNWYVSSPVSGATTAVLNASVAKPVYTYNEPTGTSAPWTTISNTTTGLTILKGYITNQASSGVVTFTGGNLNSGTKDIPLTRTSGQTKEGFNLVGNPFPAHLNWTESLANSANASSTIWYRTKPASYAFHTYNATSGIGSPISATGKVPPMQAFWVRVNAGGGTLTVNNTSNCTHETSNPLKVPSLSQPILRMQVSNGINADEAIIYFNSNATDGLDDYDSEKMFNNSASIPEIYTTAGSENLVINGMSAYTYNTSVALGFNAGESNTYTISASQLANFDADTRIVLVDNLRSVQTDLSAGESYTFTSDATSSTTRFTVLFKSKTGTTEVENTNINHKVYTSGDKIRLDIYQTIDENASVTVYNCIGQSIYTQKINSNKIELNKSFKSGVYFVYLQNVNLKSTEKVIVK